MSAEKYLILDSLFSLHVGLFTDTLDFAKVFFLVSILN